MAAAEDLDAHVGLDLGADRLSLGAALREHRRDLRAQAVEHGERGRHVHGPERRGDAQRELVQRRVGLPGEPVNGSG